MAIPFDVTIQGQALNDNGFEALDTISGIGLMTSGFLWGLKDIWSPGEQPAAPASNWVDCTDD